MGIYVNTNINSLIAQRSLTSATTNMQNAITRLSTGLRVNHAGDDAAGLCVAQGLETLIRGNSRAKLNIQDGLNMMYIAEGGMEGVTEDLQRIRELCIQVASDIYSPEQKQTLMNEIQQRLEDIDVIANTTSFNGVVLTNGTNPEKMTIQSGCGSDEVNNSINIAPALTNMLTSALGVKLNIVAITRGETRINIPAGREILCAFDKITVVGTDREIEAFRECVAQREREREKKISARKNMNVYIEQFVVEEGSPLVGHSINEVGLRDKVACLIIGIERKGEAIMNPASTFVFEAEDVVWVVGELRSILRLSGEQRVALSKKR